MTDRTRQIDRYLDGELSDREIGELFQWVAADPGNADLFARQCLLDQHVYELLQDGAASNTLYRRSVKRRPRLRMATLAVSASILIALGLAVWQTLPTRSQRAPAAPAVIAQSVGGYDAAGKPLSPGQQVRSGRLTVDRGVVRIDFASGAKVAVEGPADLRILDRMHIGLDRGVVTAMVPESAVGFAIDTSVARVVDLGTAFGISVGDDGLTEVCVFDGAVEVDHRAKGSTTSPPRRVREGQAVQASNASVTIDSVEFKTTRYERAWPVNSGVLQATGSMRFVSPGPSLDPEKYEDNEHIVIFPEKKNVQLDAAIRVGQSDPGEFRLVPFEQTKTIPAGQRVSSYLLQLKSAWTKERQDRKQRVVGQVTFAEPIVGLISRNRLIKETDSLFGSPKLKYETPSRSVEPRPEGDPRKGFDKIILAADQRTLILDLQASPNRIDQIRVLVEAP